MGKVGDFPVIVKYAVTSRKKNSDLKQRHFTGQANQRRWHHLVVFAQ
jgi:hypothetical protein